MLANQLKRECRCSAGAPRLPADGSETTCLRRRRCAFCSSSSFRLNCFFRLAMALRRSLGRRMVQNRELAWCEEKGEAIEASEAVDSEQSAKGEKRRGKGKRERQRSQRERKRREREGREGICCSYLRRLEESVSRPSRCKPSSDMFYWQRQESQ